jgi:methyl-accepting chemotaxis protein
MRGRNHAEESEREKGVHAVGASSALICCAAFNLVSGGGNWPVQIGVSLLLLVGGGVIGHFVGRFYGARAEIIVGGLHALAKGRLDHRISLDGKDDFAWLGYEYNAARKAVKQLVERLQTLSTTLTDAAVGLSGASGEARETVTRQLDSIRAVGSAIEQMSGRSRTLNRCRAKRAPCRKAPAMHRSQEREHSKRADQRAHRIFENGRFAGGDRASGRGLPRHQPHQ